MLLQTGESKEQKDNLIKDPSPVSIPRSRAMRVTRWSEIVETDLIHRETYDRRKSYPRHEATSRLPYPFPAGPGNFCTPVG